MITLHQGTEQQRQTRPQMYSAPNPYLSHSSHFEGPEPDNWEEFYKNRSWWIEECLCDLLYLGVKPHQISITNHLCPIVRVDDWAKYYVFGMGMEKEY